MRNAISLKGHVLVEDVITALEPKLSEEALATINKELEQQLAEHIMLDDCEVLVEEAIDTLDDVGKLPEPEDIAYLLEEGDVRGLAEAIRCGEREKAEMLLDAIFGVLPGAVQLREWIDRGRYSKHAREVMRRPVDVTAIRQEVINTPEPADFMAGVPLEAAHQRERYPSEHDAGKSPFDWFWLVGYLAQKAAGAAVAGDVEKAKHHTISTAAALANWHLALTGSDTRMRPGIEPPVEAQVA